MSESALVHTDSLEALREEQARILKERAPASCLIVGFVVSYTSAIVLIVETFELALIWFTVATFMIAVTFAYSKLMAPAGITANNYKSYLQGHIIISAMTGAVWGGFAIYQIDFSEEYRIFVALLIVSSITLGGVLPSSAYRPGYIALSMFAVPPLGIFLLFEAPAGIRLTGIGLLVFFLFVMYVSAKVEIETRENIASRNARNLNKRLVKQSELLKQANQEKNRFLAATSHDLSQPLHAQGFFMQALRPVLNTAEQRSILDKIEESWKAQNQLLRGIVDVSRIDSGAVVPKLSTIDLKDHVENLTDEFAVGLSAGTKFHCDIQAVNVHSDPVLLARIIRNILSNAQKYSGPEPEISVAVKRVEEYAEIVIGNNGPVLEKRDQERIFDEYVQLNRGNSETGIGLGLSIVKRLANLLEIGLDLQSSKSEGTRFILSIPVSRRNPEVTEAGRLPAGNFNEKPLIILVDDETAIVSSMTSLFQSWNCRVVGAGDAASALDMVSRMTDTPSLLIVDKKLGADDGSVLIEKLREEANESIPAILITGNTAGISSDKMAQDIHIMNKPIDPADMYRAMKALISLDQPE